MTKQARIISTTKDPSGLYWLKIFYKEDAKEVLYHYSIAASYPLEKILRKKVFTFRDLNFIKEHGELVRKEG
jgi:hypothetical protein